MPLPAVLAATISPYSRRRPGITSRPNGAMGPLALARVWGTQLSSEGRFLMKRKRTRTNPKSKGHLMALTMRVVSLLYLLSALCFAETVSGVLVNSKCYAAEERNVNPTDTETYVDRDRNLEIRYCHPRAKTKSFAVVTPDGESFELDSAGNAKAIELVRKTGKKSVYEVAVTGGMSKHIIQVESIALAK